MLFRSQILRHRSFTFQEFSQRYSTATELEDLEWRGQGKTNRQVGDEVIELDTLLTCKVKQAQRLSVEAYNELVNKGVARECARMVLPLNTTTTVIVNGTIRSFIHYLEIRCEEATQKEHRIIADEIKKVFIKNFPSTSAALGWDI